MYGWGDGRGAGGGGEVGWGGGQHKTIELVRAPINLYHPLVLFSRRQTDDIFLTVFPENRLWQFMQLLSPKGENFYEMSKPIFWEK